MEKLQFILWSIKFKVIRLLESVPGLYHFIYATRYRMLRSRHINRLIQQDTDIVIEGFPRSANSFAARAFEEVQKDKVKISTHFHSHAPIALAKKWNIPCMVLIRDPRSSIISLRALEVQAERKDGKKSSLKQKRIRSYLRWYLNFYRNAYKYRNFVVFSKFEDTTKNFSSVIRHINQKYNKQYEVFSHNNENVSKIFNNSKFHLSPSSEREQIKELFKREFDALEKSKVSKECNRIYREIINYIEENQRHAPG